MRFVPGTSLYLVITEGYGNGRSATEIAKYAIRGGVDVIQMREKTKPAKELIALGKELAALCKNSHVTFIVNDDPFLAREVNACGVHLGQEDMKLFPPEAVRRILGPKKIIGASTHSMEQFREVNKKDFDYIAFGPIFETKTKDYHIGTEDISKALSITQKKIFFIGGIDLVNVDSVLKEGGRDIAVMRAVTEADDITAAVKKFKDKIKPKEGAECNWMK